MKKSKQFEVRVHGLGGPIHAFTVWAATYSLVLRELDKLTSLKVSRKSLYKAGASRTYGTDVPGVRVTLTLN